MSDSETLVFLARLLGRWRAGFASTLRCLIGRLPRQAPFARLASKQADFAIKNQFPWSRH